MFIMAMLLYVPECHPRSWQGCCSWHGGITYQCVNGRMLCVDGTLSPSCFCNGGHSAPLYSPGPQAPRNHTSRSQSRNPGGRTQFRDWIVTPFISQGNVNASVEAYTEYKGSFYREQFSKRPLHSGGMMKGPRGAEYNISYVFVTDCGNMENGSNVRLQYSFNQSGRFKEARVLHYSYGAGKITVYFQPGDVPAFYNSCLRGTTITLKVMNSRGETWTRFVLYGYTRAMNDIYARLN